MLQIAIQNNTENNSRSCLLNCCRLSNPNTWVKIPLIVSRIVHMSVSLYGNTWKTQLPYIFKERKWFVYSYISLSISLSLQFSWGWWEGDNQRSDFSSHPPLQRSGASRHVKRNKSDNVGLNDSEMLVTSFACWPSKSSDSISNQFPKGFGVLNPRCLERDVSGVIETFLHNINQSFINSACEPVLHLTAPNWPLYEENIYYILYIL